MRLLKNAFLLFGLICLALWFANTSQTVKISDEQFPKIIAHRGLHQIYIGDDRSRDSCHASPIALPEHSYIANTIPSMNAAFELGADVVELDIHLTIDQQFAVFHDWRLECRTNSEGVTHDLSMDALKTIDIGYNLSPDGQSFPFRGKGIGLMPSLNDVFQASLGGQFLVNFKSKREIEGIEFAQMLQHLDHRSQVFGVYGGSTPTQTAIANSEGLRGYDRQTIKGCLKDYMLIGWMSYVPNSCRDTIVAIPVNYAPYLWGWPHRFTK